MNVPVVWHSFGADSPARGYWDQAMLEWLFDRGWWVPAGLSFEHHDRPGAVHPDDGMVLVTPGHGGANAARAINHALRGRPWAVVIVTSDEEAVFPYWLIHHENMVLWRQYVDPNQTWRPDRAIPCGWTTGTRDQFDGTEPPTRDIPLVFRGQVTDRPEHRRRREAVAAIAAQPGLGEHVNATGGFAQGLPQDEYRAEMTRARWVPCPTGNHSPDTFRMYEALEAGAVPILDGRSTKGATGYWSMVFPNGHPFAVVDDWHTLESALVDSPTPAVASAWWQQWKRSHAYDLVATIRDLAGDRYDPPRDPVDDITVIMPTSPIESHPDTSVIDETIASIRRQLPHAEIIVGCDPPRPELTAKYGGTWGEYVDRIVWNANHRWHNVLPIVRPEWGHQANTTRDMLTHVRTPLVLFVEHDTPIVGDIEWHRMAEIVLAAEVDHMRLHYDVSIHPEHRHLMFRDPVTDDDGFTYQRTRQWSQRPHMARTDWYRHVIDSEFPVGSRTMIEDWMHGVCENNTEWDRWRLAIYHPNDDSEWGIKRSAHLDGRNHADPKFDMAFGR